MDKIKLTRKQKVSHSAFVSFRAEYDAQSAPTLRFGQAFLNRFGGEDISFPALYYEMSRPKAEQMIYENFIKFDS